MADIIRRTPRALRRWDWPFGRMFEDLFEGLENEFGRWPVHLTERRFLPAIDVTEDDSAVTVTAEVAGMAKDDLEVTVEGDVLILKGEKKEEETKEGVDFHRVERRYGQFERRMRLPEYVNAEKIEASCKDGVLKLRLPKEKAAKAKPIQIKGE